MRRDGTAIGGARACAIVALAVAAGCARGSVTFSIDGPGGAAAATLSPLSDGRASSFELADITGGVHVPLGAAVNFDDMTGALGDLPVGTYDLALSLTGEAQLLGMARSKGVTIVGGQDQTVTLHMRKPLAYFGAGRTLYDASLGMQSQLPPPDSLGIIDITLPSSGPTLELPSPLGNTAVVAASTFDGQYELVGGGNTVYALSTATHKVARSFTVARKNGGGAPVVRGIAVTPDASRVVAITDGGYAVLADFQGFLAGGASAVSVPETEASSLRRIAVSPDGQTIAMLSGPSWDSIDCGNPPPTFIDTLTAGATTATSQKGPPGATGIAFDQGGTLLIAEPCSGGIFPFGGSDAVVHGTLIYDVAVVGDKVIGVSGALADTLVAVDPDDPTNRNVDVKAVQVFVGSQATPAATVVWPVDRISLRDPTIPDKTNYVEIHPQATSFVAYSVAASPDGSHLVVADRTSYVISDFRFVDLSDQSGPIFYCTLNLKRDVYHVTEIDTATATVGYQATTGYYNPHDVNADCNVTCYDCYLDPQNCRPSDGGCTFAPDGYAPDGVSVLMGSR